jgi:uncharacterized protein YcaQ
MSPRERLSADEARRVALAAQGFGRSRPRREPDGWALRRVLAHVGQIQIDSVNVLERAHYLPLFSRLGPYRRELIDDAAYRAPRRLFEYWGHEASLLPVETQPLLRWRMERAAEDAWGSMVRVQRERPELVEEVFARIEDHGPLSAADLAEETPRRTGPWWDWTDSKKAVEWLFWSGRITSAGRRNFQRLYAVPEAVLPRRILETPTPAPADAQRDLVRIAARAMGVAAEPDLRDYFRLPTAESKQRVAELVEAGELRPVEVEGWGRTQAYLWHETRVPRRLDAHALIGPFDSLIWMRPRVKRLFGFEYRLEIYVPKPKRVHGYYVLPFLFGDRLVARVDLKSDRKAGRLLVHATHSEPGAPPEARDALATELGTLAGWLGLAYS